MRRYVCLLLLLLVLPGCAPQTQETPQGSAAVEERTLCIGVSFPTTDLLFRRTMYQLLLESYPPHNGRVEIVFRDAENSLEGQNQDILDLTAQGVDGIILVPHTLEGHTPSIEYANDRGVPVLALDNRVETSFSTRVIGFVGADHYAMGREAARLLLEVLEEDFPEQETWNVIQLSGIPDSSGAVDRGKGIADVLEQEGRVSLLGSYNGEFTYENARSVTADCLAVFPEIHGFICQNDLMAEGCYQALQDAGVEDRIAVVGIDGQRSVVESVARGEIDGTILQSPEMVLDGVERMLSYLEGDRTPWYDYESTYTVTRDNAGEYLESGLAW